MVNQRLMAVLLLGVLIIVPLTVYADRGMPHDDGDHPMIFGVEAKMLGEIARNFMIFSVTVMVWKPAFIYMNKNANQLFETPKESKKKLKRVDTLYMRLHYWISFAAVVIGGLHGYGSMEKDNGWMYWAGWAGMVLMSLTGALMLWKWPPKKVRKGSRMLHTQRVVLILTIVLLFVAHG